MEIETRDKYIAILKKGHTLKADKEDMLEVVAGDEELSSYKDQSGKFLKDNQLFLQVKGKVIAKIANIGEDKVLYWCPCEFSDIMIIIGASEFNGSKYNTKFIQKEDQLSLYGKDVKKSINNIEPNNLNPVEANFYYTYIETEHPLADNVFYTLYVKEINGDQIIKCSRNTALSPRPIKKDDQ